WTERWRGWDRCWSKAWPASLRSASGTTLPSGWNGKRAAEAGRPDFRSYRVSQAGTPEWEGRIDWRLVAGRASGRPTQTTQLRPSHPCRTARPTHPLSLALSMTTLTPAWGTYLSPRC